MYNQGSGGPGGWAPGTSDIMRHYERTDYSMQQQPPQQQAPTSQHHSRNPHHQPQQANPHAYHMQMAHMQAHLTQQYLQHPHFEAAAAAAASGGSHESAAAAAAAAAAAMHQIPHQQPQKQPSHFPNLGRRPAAAAAAPQNPAATMLNQPAGLMLPPQSAGSAASRHALERRKAEARRQRQVGALQSGFLQEKEASKAAVPDPSLFSAPVRVETSTSSELAGVFGNYEDAKQFIGTGHTNIGVDYLPPTPAPVRVKEIGEDDDDEPMATTPVTPTPPPRPPDCLMNRNKSNQPQHLPPPPLLPTKAPDPWRPRSPQLPPPPPREFKSPLPTRSSINHNSHHAQQPQPPPYGSNRHQQPPQLPQTTSNNSIERPHVEQKSSPILATALSSLSSSNSTSSSSHSGQRQSSFNPQVPKPSSISNRPSKPPILNFDNPLPSNPTNVNDILAGFAALPPPLTAIETPRINDHEGNNSKSVPKYSFSLIGPPPSAFAPAAASSNDTAADISANQNTDSKAINPALRGRIEPNLRLSGDSDSDLSNQNLPNDFSVNTMTTTTTSQVAAAVAETAAPQANAAAASKSSTKTDSGSDSGSESDSSDSDSSQSDHEQRSQKTKKQLQMEQLHKADKAAAGAGDASASVVAAAAAAVAADHDASAAEAAAEALVATPLSSHDPDLKVNPEMDPEKISEAGLEPDNDEFSLEHILRNKSTHSPGPQPSPKVSHLSSKKMTPTSVGSRSARSQREAEEEVEEDVMDEKLRRWTTPGRGDLEAKSPFQPKSPFTSSARNNKGQTTSIKAESSDEEEKVETDNRHQSSTPSRGRPPANKKQRPYRGGAVGGGSGSYRNSSRESSSSKQRNSSGHHHHSHHESPSKTPNSTTSSGSSRPMPRKSAVATIHQDNDDMDVEMDDILDPVLSSRRAKATAVGAAAVTAAAPRSKKKVAPPPPPEDDEISLSSSSDDDDDEKDEDWGKTPKAKGGAKFGAKGGGSGAKGGGGKGKAKGPVKAAKAAAPEAPSATESPLKKDEAVASSKKGVMKSIFACLPIATKMDHKSGTAGIKVEVGQGPRAKGSKVKVEPAAESPRAAAADHPDDEEEENALKLRPMSHRIKQECENGPRPMLYCRIPLNILSTQVTQTLQPPGASPQLSHCSIKVNINPELDALASSSRRRRSRHDSSASSNVSRRSHKKRRRNVNPGAENDSDEDAESVSSGSSQRKKRRKKDKRRASNESSSQLMPPPEDKRRSGGGGGGGGDVVEPDVDDTDFDDVTRLREEAEREPSQETKSIKYLRAALLLVGYGNMAEQRSSGKDKACKIYGDALNLIKNCHASEVGNFDNKLAVLSLRCQSLLHLKLYKIQKERYKKEWTECQKIIDKHIQNAASAQASSPNVAAVAAAAAVGGGGANASNGTPSPAGSEGDVSVCSKSSGYTSAGELSANNYGVPTPPTNGFGGSNEVINFSVPSNVFKTHYQMGSHVSKSHDLWEEADIRINRGRGGCQDFLAQIDGNGLTLHSTLKDLVKHTQKGLDLLSRIKDGNNA